ncbi:MAG: type II secretion system protein GspL [Pseudomonadota bacterium]
MSTTWLVSAPDTFSPEAVWSWRLQDAAAAMPAEHGGLAELGGALAGAHAVHLLVPAARVISVPLTVPLRQQRQLQQALPYLLEENLASDIENLHVVPGDRIDGQRMQALAVDRKWFAGLLAQLRTVGIDPAQVTSEALALPLPDNGSTMLLDGVRSLLRTGDGHTLAFDQQDAVVVAATLAAQNNAVVQVLLGRDGDPLVARAVESELQLSEAPPQVLVQEQPQERMSVFAGGMAGRAGANLRQGAYAHTQESLFALGFNWRPLAWLAASWVVLALGYQIAVGISHARAVDAVHEAQASLYRQIFPGSRNVDYPRRQMENQLKNAGGGGSFTTLIAQTTEGIAALDKAAGTAEARYTPRTLAWDAEQGQLRIDIVARSLEDLEKLRVDLQSRGLSVDIGAGVSQDGGYKARMNVGMKADGRKRGDA